MIGQTVSHYKVLEKLGEGGMGIVYKAEDTRLKRTVALKFLSAQAVGSDEEKARFVHEAQAAASLNHPNICTIHEIDESKGQSFIAMECIEGKSLKARIESGPLKLDETLDIAIQITEGLQEAHQKDVTHRDIKSANIMVTEKGQAKIMDFGLARLGGRTKVTKTGTTLGTVAYMSPEQARGEVVDHRADIWSLGIMLYEMATGQLPFRGDHDQAVVYSILNVDPGPLTGLRTGVPLEFERIVSKCIEKKPAERYQTAGDLAADLRHLRRTMTVQAPLERLSDSRMGISHLAKHWPWLAVLVMIVVFAAVTLYRHFTPPEGRPIPGRKMLVVLPFENLGASEDEYFADGITEEITARLAGIQALGVIARTSSIQYKKTNKTIPQIGAELGVDYILEGTIRWQKTPGASNRVRITPQLIRVSDATHLWADVYDEALTEVFQVQANVAAKVVSALNVSLLESERRSLESKPTGNLEAFDYYLRGNEYFKESFTDEKSMRAAARLYQKAVELDSNFALAHARLSRAYTELYWHQGKRGQDLALAKRALAKAQELDPDLPDIHVALGSYYYHNGDFDKALEEFAIALESQPHNSDILAEIGYVQRRQGQGEQAVASLKKAVQLDPLSSLKADILGETYLRTRQYDEAEAYLDRAISLAPDADSPYLGRAWVHIMRDGNAEAAHRILKKAAQVMDLTPAFSHWWALVDVFARDYEGGLKKLTVEDPASPGEHLYERAAVYELMGKPETARSFYDSARVMLEERVAAVPEDAECRIGLSFAYAGLGRKEDAIREGELAMRLAPISQDAIANEFITFKMAWIYTMVGESDAAIDQLEELLSMPSLFSTSSIRINPIWDPLRSHPRFRKLLQGNGQGIR